MKNNKPFCCIFPFIALASSSLQRQVLLAQIGVKFRVLNIKVNECPILNEGPAHYVCQLALAKARAGWTQQLPIDRLPVLGADTTVVVEGEILGKPEDSAHADLILARLSGRSYQVMTAVALVDDREQYRLSMSTVTFKQLTETERQQYLASGEGIDKAGAYEIQDRAALFISDLKGSYSGVMGLPLYETGELLQSLLKKME